MVLYVREAGKGKKGKVKQDGQGEIRKYIECFSNRQRAREEQSMGSREHTVNKGQGGRGREMNTE